MKTRTLIIGALVLLVVSGGAVSLLKKNKDAHAAQQSTPTQASAPSIGGAGGAPVSVSTIVARQRDQPIVFDATGTVSPLNQVDVRPQLSGLIAKVNVREGQFVQAGELLFTLDDRSDQVNLAKAHAQLEKDRAALAEAQRQLARSRDLIAKQFIAQSALDTAQTQSATQLAAVSGSQAAVDAAQLSLGYNRIVAPSGGRIGAINVFPGTYVQPSGAPLLTITQLDPIAVSFNVPQTYLPDVLHGLAAGNTAVRAELPGTSGQVLNGKLQFVDSAVDATSGTVRVKAIFGNAQHVLWPGAYATVHLTVRTLLGAIVVPQEAIINTQEGTSVYLIGPDNKAVRHKVSVVYQSGLDAVVDGLAAGDTVIVDGRRNVKNGSSVVVRNGDPAATPSRVK
ncbi:MAG: efflux RND transporter periplasmic adaptor subunit, partial [Betaproteobacteria bacterium]